MRGTALNFNMDCSLRSQDCPICLESFSSPLPVACTACATHICSTCEPKIGKACPLCRCTNRKAAVAVAKIPKTAVRPPRTTVAISASFSRHPTRPTPPSFSNNDDDDEDLRRVLALSMGDPYPPISSPINAPRKRPLEQAALPSPKFARMDDEDENFALALAFSMYDN